MFEYLEKLVSFQSVTSDQAAVRRLLDYVASFLEERGLKPEISVNGGIHSLYASTSGMKHSKVLLQGHIDVVPGDQPFRRDSDKIYGRGSYDMLFGTAAFMKLIDELSDSVHTYNIGILLTGDEEMGGKNGVKAMLEKEQITTDICILPDAGMGFGTLNIGAKGVYQPVIRINGKAHHGSRPWEGDGAAAKLVRFLAELESVFDASEQSNSTMTVSTLSAGTVLNQGPNEAITGLDIRYKDKIDLARIEEAVKKLLKEYDGEVIEKHGASDYQLDTKNPLVQQFIDVYARIANQEIVFVKAHGSSDARFFSEHSMPVLMFRPDGGGAHGDNEWLSIKSLNKFYDVLKEYVTAISNTESMVK